jgi:hypothetical protein
MPSPFPGMDPYLEAPRRWLEFHNHLAAEVCAALNRTLDPRYVASLTSSIAYQEMPLTLYRVEILTAEEEQLATAIEILSPSNKRRGHEDALDYRRKRRDLCRSSAHLMEIDLLRGDERPPLDEPVPEAPYYVLVSRAERRPRVQVWPIQLRDPLPAVPVPVLEPDPDAPLDLQAALTSAYERGAFTRKIDYQRPPPPPPLSVEEAAWVEAVLRQHRSRRGEAGGEH